MTVSLALDKHTVDHFAAVVVPDQHADFPGAERILQSIRGLWGTLCPADSAVWVFR